MKIKESNPIYLIPFDEKYFLLGVILLMRLKQFVPDFSSVYVLDFGLTNKQLNFLEDFGVNVIPIPIELKGAHPYKLKSNLITYLRHANLLGHWIVLLDADMMLLKSPVDEIRQEISSMAANSQSIALCKDMGPSSSIREFLDSYAAGTVKFRERVSSLDTTNPYCNIGFVIFSPDFNFYKFKYLSDAMEGEVCWEQNAINLMCLEDKNQFLLDAKKWNFHGERLLSQYCKDDDPYIIHLTSTSTNLVQGPFDFMVDGRAFTFFFRYFKNTHIVDLQRGFLEKLASDYNSLFIKNFS